MWRQLSTDNIPFPDVVFWCWESGGEEEGCKEGGDEGGLHRVWCAWWRQAVVKNVLTSVIG